MSLTRCRLHILNRPEKLVYVSSELHRQLGLTGKRTIGIRLGSKSTTVNIRPLKKKGMHLYVSSAVRNLLMLPPNYHCYIRTNSDGELHIGPLLGIMTINSSYSPGSPFGTKTNMIRRYLDVGSNKAFFFAFTPRDIHWEDETVTGHFYQPRKGWVRKTVPLPDAVFNRLFSRKKDTSPEMYNLKMRFSRRNIPFFNFSYFDKWDVYSMLEGESEASHIPESYLNPSLDTIRTMLRKHRFIYLKPSGGSQGNGIFRLTYKPQRGYFARFRRRGKNVVYQSARFSNIASKLRMNQGSMRKYVVQQGIRLIEIDQCPVDFRVHLNKNGMGKWTVTGIGAKKAGRGSVTTHIKNGGRLLTSHQALNTTFGARSQIVEDKIKRVSIQLAEAIEKNYKHGLGELGLDIGVDDQEQIWMFEANAMPGRSIFKHPDLKSGGRANLNYIFEYLMYLSGFDGKGSGR